MPLPKPREGEERDAFMSRCMGNETMQTDFPEQDQRAAVCMTQWRDKDKAMETRAYSILEIKAVREDERVIEGLATTPTPDRIGDIVEPLGAKFVLPTPLLWQHRSDEPIGFVETAKASAAGIPFRARIAKIEEPGELKNLVDKAWHAIKYNLVRGVSIGFRSLEREFIKDSGGIRFKKWEWLELSLVTIPANAEATISVIKSFDAKALAASGRSRTASTHHPGVSGKTKDEGTTKMKSVQDQITELEARCAEHAEAMQTLNDKEEAEGSLETADREELEAIEKSAKADGDRLRRLRTLASTIAIARHVDGATPEGGSRSRAPAAPVRTRVEVRERTLEERSLDMGAAAWCLAVAKGDPWRAQEVAKGVYSAQGRPQIAQYLKTQVPGAATTDPTWLGPLAEPQLISGDFVEFLRASTIVGRFGTGGVPSLRRIPFNVKVPVQTSGGLGYWVGEGRAKPLTQFDVTTATIPFYKVANIAVVSEEMLRYATVSAETFIRNALRDALQARLDADFIDPAITLTAGIRPASITNGSTTSASTAVTAAEVMADLKTLIGAFITAGIGMSSLVWIMRESAALALSTMVTTLGQREFPDISVTGGTLLQIPVITSQHVGSGIVVLVSADNIYLADDGGVSISLSREASLEMDTAPASMINNDASPAVSVEATMVSMFQTNSVAIRAERAIAWLKRRSTAVAYLTSVGWGNTGSSPDGAPI